MVTGISSKMYIYHSFPNRKNCRNDEEISKGLKILESIVKNGLLLTPQKYSANEARLYKKNDSTNTQTTFFSAPVNIKQIRICFTCLYPNELESHCETFGRFSIGFETSHFRKIGGLPAIYIPITLTYKGFESLGNSLVIRLHQLKQILNNLENIDSCEKVIKQHFMNNVEEGRVGSAFPRFYFNRENFFESIHDLFNSMENLICPTEIVENLEELDNFKLREWRIHGGIKLDNVHLTQKPDTEQRKYLNGNFKFSEEDLKDCRLYKNFDEKHILLHDETHIVVPSECQDKCKKLLEDSGIDIRILPLENF